MKASKKLNLVFAMLLLAASSLSFGGQSIGQEKPYQQWTIGEVEKLLTDSPWAQTRSKGVAIGYDNPVVTGANSPASPEAVTLRLRSASSIRQALLRLRQLKAKYDRMSDPDKAKLDDKNKVLLDCPACAENYVIALAPGPGRGKGVSTVFQNMSLAEAKLKVTLENERGDKRELVHFSSPRVQGDEAVFFFSRLNDKGEPLLNQNSKKLIVLFAPEIFSSPVALSKFEFDVSKMLMNGAVDF